MPEHHRLLRRQIKRFLNEPDSLPPQWEAFLNAVNEAYWQADEDRQRLERSLELSSQELLQVNAGMRQLLATMEAQVEERTAALMDANTRMVSMLQELQNAQTQLIQSEKMSSLGQLVAGIAHEINNPVNFIHGNLEFAIEYAQNLLSIIQLYQDYYPDPDPKIQQKLQEMDLDFMVSDFSKIMASMKHGTRRIREIVLSLRTFSRLDEADMKQVDIHEGLESTLLILQHRIKPHADHLGIEIVKDYDPELPAIECFSGQLNQVFMNVLTNAIDALEEHWKASPVRSSEALAKACGQAEKPQITIKTSCINETWAEIAIADNGPGISEDVQPYIFNPFFTTKPTGKGTGMGMSISYQIVVERHHGNLDFTSTPGTGTIFSIRIPIRQHDA